MLTVNGFCMCCLLFSRNSGFIALVWSGFAAVKWLSGMIVSEMTCLCLLSITLNLMATNTPSLDLCCQNIFTDTSLRSLLFVISMKLKEFKVQKKSEIVYCINSHWKMRWLVCSLSQFILKVLKHTNLLQLWHLCFQFRVDDAVVYIFDICDLHQFV